MYPVPQIISELATQPELIRLCQAYQASQNTPLLELNLFRLVSDQYRKENFHSDVLAALLDPTRSPEGGLLLQMFLKLLVERGVSVEPRYFEKAIVLREKHRIDILIKSQNDAPKQAIIIENKINDAADTHRQLPTYYRQLVQQGYQIIAIVYLTLDLSKTPTLAGWQPEEISAIQTLLIHLPVYSGMPDDLYRGWLKKCEPQARTIDGLCLLRHYADLLKHISRHIMDLKMLSDFHNIVRDNYPTLAAVNQLWNQLPQYYAHRITQQFKPICAPFKRTWVYKDTAAVFDDYVLNGHTYAIDIYCSTTEFAFIFFERSNVGKLTDNLRQLIIRLELEQEFEETSSGYKKIFAMPTGEAELDQFIPAFLAQLERLEVN